MYLAMTKEASTIGLSLRGTPQWWLMRAWRSQSLQRNIVENLRHLGPQSSVPGLGLQKFKISEQKQFLPFFPPFQHCCKFVNIIINKPGSLGLKQLELIPYKITKTKTNS